MAGDLFLRALYASREQQRSGQAAGPMLTILPTAKSRTRRLLSRDVAVRHLASADPKPVGLFPSDTGLCDSRGTRDGSAHRAAARIAVPIGAPRCRYDAGFAYCTGDLCRCDGGHPEAAQDARNHGDRRRAWVCNSFRRSEGSVAAWSMG